MYPHDPQSPMYTQGELALLSCILVGCGVLLLLAHLI